MIPDHDRTYFIQFFLNFMSTLLILGVLVATGIYCYRIPRFHAANLAHVGSTDTARLAVQYHYALTGNWPTDAEMLQFPYPKKRLLLGFQDHPLTIEDGSLQLQVESPQHLPGALLSLRPATPVADPAGPVHWVAGPGNVYDWREIHGPDRTTVAPETILTPLR